MATVTAAMVKQLREMTGAGMMDCKKALSNTDGDMDKAVEFLREKGLAAAAKKAGRIAAEGLVKALVENDKKAVVVEVNSETDFVAKNVDFQNYVGEVAAQALETKAQTIEEFMAEPWALEPSKTVEQELSSKISVIGEKLSIRRFEKMEIENGCIVSYIHGGGRIGVLVEAETDVVNEAVKEALKNVAMQIAALKPQYVSRDEISDEFIEKEREILKTQAKNEMPDKPDNIIDKMIIGRLNKELKEFCLLDQQYVKDGDLTVGKYLQQVSKEVGGAVTVKKFVRFETGEGMQKKEENFAEEVAKQIGQ
ncbi:translation elongation factor Ts [Cuneatibacter sp. NSJ-177]|uniref:translation elongation factor Ts n=1 Tax=Cuneatibacter sp. NSJ-177 TaxID=2931401 RepID=UPI001FD17F85|nr:translation elongation factor Ts [Cuneatibacter sp. NSJ-177]MCJ7835977.1 translation elongation factor Ts [Cuneatibacter sp. NSJ-177]